MSKQRTGYYSGRTFPEGAGYFSATATTASTVEQLRDDAVASGAADPTHTPRLPAQSYTNTTSGQRFEWWGGAWH